MNVNSDARSTPNQSKSFRVLQQITDTMKLDPKEKVALSQPAELHQPHYSRPLGPNDMNEHQLRKIQLNDQSNYHFSNSKKNCAIHMNSFDHFPHFYFF